MRSLIEVDHNLANRLDECGPEFVAAWRDYLETGDVRRSQPFLDLYGIRIKPGWLPIETAPKDGTYILATLTDDAEILGERCRHWAGRSFVICHEGATVSSFDLGWALFPGWGGVPDHWFTHWQPLPEPPAVINNGGDDE